MIVGARVQERMSQLGLSQAELARRVGVSQPTIFQLIHRSKKGSTKLHQIARELGTTPAYLSGESDDPDNDLPAPPELESDARELVDHFEGLSSADRKALLQVARSMAAGPAASGTVHEPPPVDHANPEKKGKSPDG
jgi:transcriptional regulator with XRE-family HTH domain